MKNYQKLSIFSNISILIDLLLPVTCIREARATFQWDHLIHLIRFA